MGQRKGTGFSDPRAIAKGNKAWASVTALVERDDQRAIVARRVISARRVAQVLIEFQDRSVGLSEQFPEDTQVVQFTPELAKCLVCKIKARTWTARRRTCAKQRLAPPGFRWARCDGNTVELLPSNSRLPQAILNRFAWDAPDRPGASEFALLDRCYDSTIVKQHRRRVVGHVRNAENIHVRRFLSLPDGEQETNWKNRQGLYHRRAKSISEERVERQELSASRPTKAPELTFAERLTKRAAEIRSRTILGLDPDVSKFPAFLRRSLGKEKLAPTLGEAIFRFNKEVIGASGPFVVAYKPQIAFYEQHGLEGMRALFDTIAYLRDRQSLVVLDAKRGDVESTASAYARAWVGTHNYFGDPNPARADAITLNSYLGFDSVRPFLIENTTSGVFLLAKTSNPSSTEVQDLVLQNGEHVYEAVARLANEWESQIGSAGEYGRIGLVVGATFPKLVQRLRKLAPRALFMMPGIGTQGGELAALRPALGEDGLGAYAAVARSVLYAYDPAGLSDRSWNIALKGAVAEQAEELRARQQAELGI